MIENFTRDSKGQWLEKKDHKTYRKSFVIVLVLIALGFMVIGVFATAEKIATEYDERILAPLTYDKEYTVRSLER